MERCNSRVAMNPISVILVSTALTCTENGYIRLEASPLSCVHALELTVLHCRMACFADFSQKCLRILSRFRAEWHIMPNSLACPSDFGAPTSRNAIFAPTWQVSQHSHDLLSSRKKHYQSHTRHPTRMYLTAALMLPGWSGILILLPATRVHAVFIPNCPLS
jgi:hypothetical protein